MFHCETVANSATSLVRKHQQTSGEMDLHYIKFYVVRIKLQQIYNP